METLNKKLINENSFKPENFKIGPSLKLPEKVLQFGEGNFLRGFVDWMFNRLNEKGLFNGSIVVVQPISQGMVDVINEQDGIYTLLLRGIQNGEIIDSREIISSISRGINMYSDFDEYLKLAENTDLRVIVSNTTEAGISYNPDDRIDDTPPASFPGKLTVLLHHRFKIFKGDFSKGFIIIPCELIDRNGDNLKKTVLRLAKEWNLGEEFIEWVEMANFFLNTLVDRIVTGYPKDEIATITQQIGYIDKILNTGEIFHLWVIEGDKKLSEELPFTEAGLNVIWTNDMTPYRTRKVRILNGAHTMTVLAAYLYGMETVMQCMDDELINKYMKKGIFNEIIPTLDLPDNELVQYANDVLERFANPFIKHYLLSISLNSVSKFKTRVLPSITEYVEIKKELPKVLAFSLAALIAFYRGTEIREGALIGMRNGIEYKICDDLAVLEDFRKIWSSFDGTLEACRKVTANVFEKSDWWGIDLNGIDGLAEFVANCLHSIVTDGIDKSLRDVI